MVRQRAMCSTKTDVPFQGQGACVGGHQCKRKHWNMHIVEKLQMSMSYIIKCACYVALLLTEFTSHLLDIRGGDTNQLDCMAMVFVDIMVNIF